MKKVITLIKLLVIFLLNANLTACTITLSSEMHSLQVIEHDNLALNDLNGFYQAGTALELKTCIVYDADVIVSLNGNQIFSDHKDGTDYLSFNFVMPNIDSTLEISIDNTDFPSGISLSKILPWVETLDYSDIDYALSITNPGSIAPTFDEYIEYHIANDEELEDLIMGLKSSLVIKKENPYWDGWTIYQIKIIHKNGDFNFLSTVNNGFIIGESYYEFENFSLPVFKKSYGHSFLPQSLYGITLKKNDEVIEYNNNFFYQLIFNECDEAIEQRIEYSSYVFIFPSNEAKIIFLDRNTMEVHAQDSIKRYILINYSWTDLP